MISQWCTYTVSTKEKAKCFSTTTLKVVNKFPPNLAHSISDKCATMWYKNCQLHIMYVRTLPCKVMRVKIVTKQCNYTLVLLVTRSSADADNRLDAFSGQSRSTNMVPFHTLHIASYCAIVTLSFTIFVFKKCHDLEIGVMGHSRSLRVLSFDRLCMVSY